MTDTTTEVAINDNQCWQAVLARDTQADNTFVYAVRSTGIYCRPSCPSRRPAREHVLFFPDAPAAEQAGFRACRRCHPQLPPGADPAAEERVALVQRVCQAIEEHLQAPDGDGQARSLHALSQRFQYSPSHLQREFKRVMGVSPRQYADAYRLQQLKERLRQDQEQTITEALYAAGYSSSSRLYEDVTRRIGMTPTEYRKGGAGMEITYTIVDSPLSRLLVATTRHGLCAVSLGDADADLVAALEQEYPAAHIQRDDDGMDAWTGELLRYLEGQQPHLDLPLDVQATAFQWQVWQALRHIPYGETRTYRELAQMIGQPTAARAVGRACATNPVSLVIPCHRAVREDGNLAGYRWGVERKQALLDQEQAAVSTQPDDN